MVSLFSYILKYDMLRKRRDTMQTPNAVAVPWEQWPRHEIYQFFSGMSNPFSA